MITKRFVREGIKILFSYVMVLQCLIMSTTTYVFAEGQLMSTQSRCLCGGNKKYLSGPSCQSVVSLTSLLKVITLTVLVDSMHNILIFFAEKIVSSFCKSYSHFFSKKFQHTCLSLDVNFNESLTNDITSFEQLGPGYPCYLAICLHIHAVWSGSSLFVDIIFGYWSGDGHWH